MAAPLKAFLSRRRRLVAGRRTWPMEVGLVQTDGKGRVSAGMSRMLRLCLGKPLGPHNQAFVCERSECSLTTSLLLSFHTSSPICLEQIDFPKKKKKKGHRGLKNLKATRRK